MKNRQATTLTVTRNGKSFRQRFWTRKPGDVSTQQRPARPHPVAHVTSPEPRKGVATIMPRASRPKTRLGHTSRRGAGTFLASRRGGVSTAAGVGVALALSLSGCGGDDSNFGEGIEPDYAGVCVDSTTHLRVEDEKCPPIEEVTAEGYAPTSGTDMLVWWYIARSANVPAVGNRVNTSPTAGSHTLPPRDRVTVYGSDTRGGKVAYQPGTKATFIGKTYGGYGSKPATVGGGAGSVPKVSGGGGAPRPVYVPRPVTIS